jgi:hypothetical protein
MKTVAVTGTDRVPTGYTVLQDEDGYFLPVRVLSDTKMEYLTDTRTVERARFWALGTAILFVQDYAARQA